MKSFRRPAIDGAPSERLVDVPEAQVIGPINATRLLRCREVCRRTGLSRTTIWRLERAGRFPRRRQLSVNAVGWIEAEIAAWIESRALRGDRLRPEGE